MIDDEAVTRRIVKTTLEAHGYDVLLAEQGTEALALYAAQGEKIALVITDMAMPVMDGRATICALPVRLREAQATGVVATPAQAAAFLRKTKK